MTVMVICFVLIKCRGWRVGRLGIKFVRSVNQCYTSNAVAFGFVNLPRLQGLGTEDGVYRCSMFIHSSMESCGAVESVV